MGGHQADDLYQKFGDAWRVSNATTLFDYAPGTSTATFTIASWPNGESPQSCIVPQQPGGPPAIPPVTALPLNVAQQHCRAIVADDARANCVQDVRVTGEPAFAQTYLRAEQIERNKRPAAPVLAFPEDFTTDLVAPVGLTWTKTSDVDGDPLIYKFCVWDLRTRFSLKDNCDAVSKRTVTWTGGLLYAVLVLVIGALVLVVLYFMGLKNRPGLLLVLAIAILAIATLAFRLGGPGKITLTVSELESGKAYYWKVIAEDGKGSTVESETRRFEIK